MLTYSCRWWDLLLFRSKQKNSLGDEHKHFDNCCLLMIILQCYKDLNEVFTWSRSLFVTCCLYIPGIWRTSHWNSYFLLKRKAIKENKVCLMLPACQTSRAISSSPSLMSLPRGHLSCATILNVRSNWETDFRSTGLPCHQACRP